MAQLGFKHSDLVAAKKLLEIHMTKLEKAVQFNSYPDACSALRAMQEECSNASKVAVALSLNSHLTDQQR